MRTFESRFEKYDLVICDELGYISFDKSDASMIVVPFFALIRIRAELEDTLENNS